MTYAQCPECEQSWHVPKSLAVFEKELQVREAAASHLSGIPAQQNATAIAFLYDQLNDLHTGQVPTHSLRAADGTRRRCPGSRGRAQ